MAWRYLQAIVAADVQRDAMQPLRLGQGLNQANAVDAPTHLRRQARQAVLVDRRQDAQAPTVAGLSLDDGLSRTQRHRAHVEPSQESPQRCQSP